MIDWILEVNGEVLQPLQLSVAEVREQFTAHTIATQYANDDRTVHLTFTGTLLWDILQSAGLKENATPKRRIMARAGDQFRCLLKWDEIDPSTSDRQILVAYEQDGAPLNGVLGPLRLAVAGDEHGRRFLRNLKTITILDDASPEEE